MRILLSTFAISPTHGSEPGVGWEFASRLAQDHDVTVLHGDLTGSARSKRELEQWFHDHPEARQFAHVYVPPSRISTAFERLHSKPGLRPLYYWGYQLWQKRALKIAQDLQRKTPFDLVHQVTYAAIWEPGYLWKLRIPYFWGPISGGNVVPLRYISILGVRGAIEAIARFVLNKLTLLTHPRIGAASRRARHIWCVTSEERRILSSFTNRLSTMLEAGTVPDEARIRTLSPGEPLRIVWSGLHIARKALPLLVRAVAELGAESKVEVHVLGAGRESSRETSTARSLAGKLGVASKFVWHGKLPREQALQTMRDAHVLIHTSLLEGTPWVVLEALASGMPVICHDTCGMATAITADCGIKIPLAGVNDSIRGFSQAIQSLIDNPSRITQLSEGAAQRAGVLCWESKIAEVNQEYKKVFEQGAKTLTPRP